MSTKTTNYGLEKPDNSDFYDVDVMNDNLDIIDTTLKEQKSEVDSIKKSVSDGKTEVANAITGQGVTTASDATFATMATNIKTVATNKYNAGVSDADGRANTSSTNYKTGYNAGVSATKKGTATAAQVLSGYTFTNASSVGASGTMVNNGAVSKTLNAGGSYTIPVGYHNGSGKVTANSLASQTSATASASQILSGATAYVNGNKVTGTMPNYGSANILTDAILLQDSNVYFNIPNTGYYVGGSDTYTSQTSLASAIGLTSDKLVIGNTVCGVSGSAVPGKRYASGTNYTVEKIEGTMYYNYTSNGSFTTGSNMDCIVIYPSLSFTPSICRVSMTFANANTGTYTYVTTLTKGCTYGTCINQTNSLSNYDTSAYFVPSSGGRQVLFNDTYIIVPKKVSEYVQGLAGFSIGSVIWEVWE